MFSGFYECLALSGDRSGFNRKRWGNLYLGGLHAFFKNIRDVSRFLSILKFHVGEFKKGEFFEVNIVDLIAIQTLSVFEPDVVREIYKNKNILTQFSSESESSETKAEKSQCAGGIVSAARREQQTHVKEVLQQLFPQVERLFGGSSYDSQFGVEWKKQLRICSKDIFDRYFQLSLPEGELTQQEIDTLMKASQNEEEFRKFLMHYRDSGTLIDVLYQLDDYRDSFPPENAAQVLTALFNIGDNLPDQIKPDGLFDFSLDLLASRLIFAILKNIKDSTVRDQALIESVKSSHGLYLPILEIFSQENRNKARDEKLISEQAIQELKKVSLKRVKLAAQDGHLKENKKLGYLLFRWKELEGCTPVKDWIKLLFRDSMGALILIKAFCVKQQISQSGDYVADINHVIDLKALSELVDIEAVNNSISAYSKDVLSEEDGKALEAFKKVYLLWKDGRCNSFFDSDEEGS